MDALTAHDAYVDKVLTQREGIFYKIDWSTIMFSNISLSLISEIFDLGLSSDFSSIFSSRYLVCPAGLGTSYCIRYNGILFQLPYYELVYGIEKSIEELTEYDLLNFNFDKIRMDISASGLDYLRNKGIDIENLFRSELANESLDNGFEYHFTRIDYAFDLINYKPEFLKRCYAMCSAYESGKGRVTCGAGLQGKDDGSVGGLKWSYKCGSENTLYLGSPGSEKLLRIYDKKLEYESKNKYASECPYKVNGELPESWIRIEFQHRNETLLLAENYSAESVFKYIFKRFAIKNGQGDHRYTKICDDWLNLYDWSKIPAILQNANFAELREAFSVRFQM